MEHDLTVVSIQQLLTMGAGHSTCTVQTIRVESEGDIHHQAAPIVVLEGSKQLFKSAAVRLMDIARRGSRIHNLIHSRKNDFKGIVVKFQSVYMNGVSNFIRHQQVALKTISRSGSRCRDIDDLKREMKIG